MGKLIHPWWSVASCIILVYYIKVECFIAISTTKKNLLDMGKIAIILQLCLRSLISCWHVTCSISHHEWMALHSVFEIWIKFGIFLLVRCLCNKQNNAWLLGCLTNERSKQVRYHIYSLCWIKNRLLSLSLSLGQQVTGFVLRNLN